MTTIVLEEYYRAGSNPQTGQPIPKLGALLKRTETSTTTSNSTLVLQNDTTILCVQAVGAHRLSAKGDTTTNYATAQDGIQRDFAVDGGATITYRADA